MSLNIYLKKQSQKIENALKKVLDGVSVHPKTLHEAMCYSVLGGGKRIRPILCLAASQVVGGNERKVLPAALAIELIHSYSLVHDDLPCMDNDEFRRGKVTCHKKFGESTALLAGDALLTLAFEILGSAEKCNISDLKRRMEALRLLAQSAGVCGMVGGQAVDLEVWGKEVNLPTMDFIHTHKTGALIAASTRTGALLGGGNFKEIKSLYEYGKTVGFLFQIVDDILDRDGYAKMFGLEEAQQKSEELLSQTQTLLAPFGRSANRLKQIAEYIHQRQKDTELSINHGTHSL